MVSDLFINGCILVTIIFITVEFLENEKIKNLSLITKDLISGISFSISSIFLMKYSIYVTPTAFLDFRSISQSSSAFYGGSISAIITGLISALFRIFHFGINQNSIITFIFMILSSLTSSFITNSCLSKKLKWIIMVSFTSFLQIVLFVFVLNDKSDLLKVIFIFVLSTVLVSLIVYYVFKHLSISHAQVDLLKQQASIDFLTGVNNARNFNFLYNETIKKLKRDDKKFSVLMLDIDFFKNINDTYGHLAGDKVLREIGYILNMFCKEFGIVGRVGGEEFCVLMKNINIEDALEFAENLRRYIEKTLFIISTKNHIHITVSIGVATYKENNINLSDVRKVADQKLYICKETGRNKVCF